MRARKASFIVVCCITSFLFFKMYTGEQKTAVIFEITTLVKTDVDGRKKALLKKMQETVRKSYSTMALWKSVRTVFDVPFICNEQSVRTEFFKFLNGIQIQEKYPTITAEGYTLPPVIAAWNLGKIDTAHAQQLTNKYIDEQSFPENDKKFYRALIYTTFDPAVAHGTRIINPKVEKILNTCCTNGRQTYLIGHSDPTLYQWLKEQHAQLLTKFNKIFFSHQAKIAPTTTFDDAWWLENLGLSNLTKTTDGYVFISDWNSQGTKTDAPPHYTSTSKSLMHIIA